MKQLKKWFSKMDVRKIEAKPSDKNDVDSDIYSTDSPINDIELDEFNRKEFSFRIARTIAAKKSTKSLVVGIYGKWGEGKTTVLNFIRSELIHHENVVTLPFNPWLFPSESELLIAFYSELAKAIGKSLPTVKEQIGKIITEYLGTLAGFFDKKEAVEKIGKFFSDVRLEELRDRIGKLLIQQEKAVVVLMDDIDRLDKDEIHALFRLIKLSANLENVTYVLAFDRDVVEEALGERYYNKKEIAGQSFLEKIVQVPINLPKVPKPQLRDFCYRQIDKALSQNEIVIKEDEVHDFSRGFIQGIEIRLETPRMAIRYANMLNFSLPLVQGEVHIADFLLIEAIRAFYSEAYEVIKDNKEAFTAINLSSMNALDNEKEMVRKTVEKVYDGLDDEEKRNLKYVLLVLFPRLKTVFENTHYGLDWEQKWADEKRVASTKYFDRYFTFSIPVGDISDMQVDEFINSLEDRKPEEIITFLRQELTNQNAESFIFKLNQRIEKITSKGRVNLAICLCLFGEHLPNPQGLFSFEKPFARAAILITRLIDRQETEDSKMDLAIQVVKIAEPISFAFEIIRWLDKKKKETDKEGLSSDNHEKVCEAFAQRIDLYAKKENIFEKFPDLAVNLVWFWKKHGNEENAEQYLANFLNQGVDNALEFLKSIIPIAYPMDGSPPHKSDFERDQYNILAEVVDLNKVFEILLNEYNDELLVEQYPHAFSKNDDRTIAKQFAWIHRKVQGEIEKKRDETK